MSTNPDAVRRYRERHPELVSARARAYREANAEVLRDKAREYMRAFREAHPEVIADRAARYRERHRERIRVERAAYQQNPQTRPKALARQMLGQAVSTGRLVRPDTCSSCSKPCRPDGHHEDYARPLDVVWLCPPCHHRLHKWKGPLP